MALAAVVVTASGQSHVAAPSVSHIDKVAHFSVFGLLATLIARCPGIRRPLYAILIVSLFGITDEFHQSFTPGRSVEFDDWLADTAGAALAVALYTLWPWYRRLLEIALRLRKRRPVVQAPPASVASATLAR